MFTPAKAATLEVFVEVGAHRSNPSVDFKALS
jgi:hypothetical protein